MHASRLITSLLSKIEPSQEFQGKQAISHTGNMNADTSNKNVQSYMDYLHQDLLIGSCQSLQKKGKTLV